MKIRIASEQVQKPILSQSMRQSIEVLLLPLMDLNTAIEQELQNNPLLEIEEEKNELSQNAINEKALSALNDLGNTSASYHEYFSDDEIFDDKPIKKEVSLEENLLQQLRVELTDPLEIKIGELIIGNLNEDGYLRCSCEEIAQLAQTQDAQLVEKTLKIIQDFEPVGIASRNLRECLLLQVKPRCNGNSELIYRIIHDHLDDLAAKRYQKVAKALNTSVDHIREAAQTIAHFEPKPARNYRPLNPSHYVIPDIFVTKDNERGYQIQINHEHIPTLRINAFYKKMLYQSNLSEVEKEFIRERLHNALQFIRSIEQRGNTLRRITQYILDKQASFFEEDNAPLIPMTLKDVAQSIDRSESTISRAVNNKYMDTPKGILAMKFFFSQGIPESNGAQGGGISSTSIKEEIRWLIDEEEKSTPLSDQHIQKYFERKGMNIARRTINKYRQGLNILPSHLRKN